MRPTRTLRAVLAALLGIAIGTALATPDPLRAAASSKEADGYVEALGLLARGDTAAALTALLHAEVESAPSGSDEEIEALTRRQEAVARRLSGRSVESLVPMVLLHEQAYRAHLEQRRLTLAVHSRRHAVTLVELYATLSQRPDADRIASNLLSSLGGRLQQVTMDSAATRLYERALELDSRNGAALLGLAGILERQGSYERALGPLEFLQSHDPGHREARLRRGINLLRLERAAEGVSELEEIVSRPESDWILSLAYQELARVASSGGDRDRARHLLLEARERLPDDPSLGLQIAYLADRDGDRATSTELVGALAASTTVSTPSPRWLYSRAPGQEIEVLRRSIEAESRRRLPRLAEALGTTGRDRRGAP